MPAVAPKKTKILVSLSVMAFFDSCTAARAMIPTVAALSPLKRAYTGPGSCSWTLATPRESPYAAIPAGRLEAFQLNLA